MRPDRIAPAAIAEEFRQEAPPVVAASVLSEGERLYVQHCLVCHGKEARGGDLGQNLVGHPNLLNLADSVDVVRVGRRRMPGFAAVLNDDQARSIVAWLVSRPID
jgi:mono/diheme cytochrome c family protein